MNIKYRVSIYCYVKPNSNKQQLPKTTKPSNQVLKHPLKRNHEIKKRENNRNLLQFLAGRFLTVTLLYYVCQYVGTSRFDCVANHFNHICMYVGMYYRALHYFSYYLQFTVKRH